MGGVLIDNFRNIIFNFSGNIKAINPLLAEKEAILFLMDQFKSSELRDHSLQIYTDSMTMIHIAVRNKGGIFNVNPLVEDEAWLRLINDHKIKISYVERDFFKGR